VNKTEEREKEDKQRGKQQLMSNPRKKKERAD
jgi:hypothetical protein